MRATILVLGVLLASACKKTPIEPVVTQPPSPAVVVEMAPQKAAPVVVPEPIEFQTAYFDFDSSVLRPDTKAILADGAKVLQENPALRIRLEGHCDERGTTEYNLALGERRAFAAHDYLVSAGIAPSRLDTLSYGEEMPVDLGHDETAWSKNRRVEFYVPGEPEAGPMALGR